MKEYLDLVRYVLENGKRKENRTGVPTLSCFAYFYKIDISDRYPLLTTKKMYFDSMLHELFWYLSGEHHIKSLKQHTKIWDAWADAEGNLETALQEFDRKHNKRSIDRYHQVYLLPCLPGRLQAPAQPGC